MRFIGRTIPLVHDVNTWHPIVVLIWHYLISIELSENLKSQELQFKFNFLWTVMGEMKTLCSQGKVRITHSFLGQWEILMVPLPRTASTRVEWQRQLYFSVIGILCPPSHLVNVNVKMFWILWVPRPCRIPFGFMQQIHKMNPIIEYNKWFLLASNS